MKIHYIVLLLLLLYFRFWITHEQVTKLTIFHLFDTKSTFLNKTPALNLAGSANKTPHLQVLHILHIKEDRRGSRRQGSVDVIHCYCHGVALEQIPTSDRQVTAL